MIVETKEHNRIIIEMNQNDDSWRFDRNASYAFTSIIESTKPNIHNYPTTIIININNFNRYHTEKPIQNFYIRDEEGNIETEVYHSIHLILDNTVNLEYNIDKEIKNFAKFLMANSMEELEKECKEDEKYMACFRTVADLSTDPEFIGYYDIEEAKRQEMAANYETGRMKGIEEGKLEGAIEKVFEMAKSMLKENMDISLIQKITGLSQEEINTLK